MTRRRLTGGRRALFKSVSMRGIRSRPMTVRTMRARAQRVFRGMGNGRTFPHLELKFHDVDLDDAIIAAAGGLTASINLIAQGVTETTRVGRKCTIRQIGWKFDVELPETTLSSSTADIVRVIMYIDKQANKATAAITDILESADYQSFNNLSNKNRFRTLMDRTYDLKAAAGGGDGTTEDYGVDLIHDSFYKKVNVPIEYNAGTGAITEITSNNIGVLLLSKNGKAGFKSKIRLRFSDL